jgi:hypothetical protein
VNVNNALAVGTCHTVQYKRAEASKSSHSVGVDPALQMVSDAAQSSGHAAHGRPWVYGWSVPTFPGGLYLQTKYDADVSLPRLVMDGHCLHCSEKMV